MFRYSLATLLIAAGCTNVRSLGTGALPKPDAAADTTQVENYLFDGGFRRLDASDIDRTNSQILRSHPYAIHMTRCCADDNVALALSRIIVDLHARDAVYLYYDPSSNYFLAGGEDAIRRVKQLARDNGASHSVRRILWDID